MTAPFETTVSTAALDETVRRLASQISKDHPQGLVVVGVLNSSVTFVADLIRALSVPCKVDFFALTHFVGGAGERARILKDIDTEVEGIDVVLAEAIVDTGLASRYVADLIAKRGARQVSICALLDRPQRRILPIELRYVGLEVGDAFLVGYGLDYKQRYRNLGEVVTVDPQAVDDDPARWDRDLYPATPS